jgi:hypothetical protein
VRVSDRLDPVAYPLAAVYVAIRRYVLWCHLPSQRSAVSPKAVLPILSSLGYNRS